MRPALLILAASLAFASVAFLPSASATDCPDPHDGPFSPCLYNCNAGWEAECELLIGGGQTVWHYYCARVGNC
jgi:hypothetical protein